MKNSIAIVSIFVMTFISLMLLIPGTVNAAIIPVSITGSGDQTGLGWPVQSDLTLTTPGTTINVNINNGDDLAITINLSVTHWNDFMGDSANTMLEYSIDFFQVNNNSNIVYSADSGVYATGPLGNNYCLISHTYHNVYESDTIRVDIDLDLLSIGTGDPVPVFTAIYGSTTTITVNAT